MMVGDNDLFSDPRSVCVQCLCLCSSGTLSLNGYGMQLCYVGHHTKSLSCKNLVPKSDNATDITVVKVENRIVLKVE